MAVALPSRRALDTPGRGIHPRIAWERLRRYASGRSTTHLEFLMQRLLAVFAILGLGTAVAIAGDPAPAEAENACSAEAAEVDCSTLEGEAKTKCEEEAKAKAEAEKPAEEAEEKKGGKSMEASNDGNMEDFGEE